MLYSKNTSRFLLISFLVFMVLALISGIFKIIHENFFSFYPIFIAGIVLSRVNISDRWMYNPYYHYFNSSSTFYSLILYSK